MYTKLTSYLALNIVAREGAEVAGALTGAHIPAVVAFLHHVNSLPLRQL